MDVFFLGTEEDLRRAHAREDGHALPPVFFFDRWPPPMGNPYPVLVPAARLILECKPPWPAPVLATGCLSLMDEAFSLGCLDYLIEPWPAHELESRLRTRAWAVELGGGAVFQYASGRIVGPAGSMHLRPKPARLLRVLAANRGRYVGKAELSALTGLGIGSSRALDMAISRLRNTFRQVCADACRPMILCEDASCILVSP